MLGENSGTRAGGQHRNRLNAEDAERLNKKSVTAHERVAKSRRGSVNAEEIARERGM